MIMLPLHQAVFFLKAMLFNAQPFTDTGTGFEPVPPGPEPGMLPLHYPAVCAAKVICIPSSRLELCTASKKPILRMRFV